MKKTVNIILIIILWVSCSNKEGQIDIADEDIITIGNKLADWGNSNCSIITINTNEVLWQDANSGGCSTVYFEYLGTDRELIFNIDSFESSLQETGADQAVINSLITRLESYLTRENKVKESLKLALENSSCVIESLLSKVENINDYSDEELLDTFKCIDNIEISEGYSSEE